MKHALLTLLCLAISFPAFADEANQRALAEKILEITKSEEAMRTGFLAVFDPILNNMRQGGMPPAATDEVKAAVREWFDTEVRWEDLKPKMIDIYVKEFSEQELKDLLEFYQSPTGQKAVTKLAVVMQQGAAVGQQYFTGKQASLNERLKPIVEKYRPAAAASPSR